MLDGLEADTGRPDELASAISAGGHKIAKVDYQAGQQCMDHLFRSCYDFSATFSVTSLAHQTTLPASWIPGKG